jgi:osmotically inducible protein OsmC
MERSASAVWHGALKDGKGTVSTGSGTLQDTAYSFNTRFENGKGTNPEELIAAALAGCFTMALSAQLGEGGLKPERLQTKALLSFGKTDAGWSVSSIHLTLQARVPGADKPTFEKAADAAKTGCPISRLLKTNITLDAKLEQ